MATWQEHLQAIQLKLQQILKQHDQLKKHNEVQVQKISELNRQKEELERRISELEEQNLLLKSSSLPLDGDEKKLLEKKIDQYLTSIDKCITSLSQ